MDLYELRNEIDRVDAALAALYEERMQLAQNIANYKRENNLPVRDQNRETVVIDNAAVHISDKNIQADFRSVMALIIQNSRKVQERLLFEDVTDG